MTSTFPSIRLQEQVKHAEELMSSNERSFVKLEQDLVQVTKVLQTLH